MQLSPLPGGWGCCSGSYHHSYWRQRSSMPPASVPGKQVSCALLCVNPSQVRKVWSECFSLQATQFWIKVLHSILDRWRPSNTKNAGLRREVEIRFPACLLRHAGRGGNRCWPANLPSIMRRRAIRSSQGTSSSRLSRPSSQVPCRKDYLQPGEHLTPNSKCCLFLLSVRSWTESNFLTYTQLLFSILLILVWDFLFSPNNSWGCLGSLLIKLL